MNIQRFKWPVLVAAGLHGALFLSTPHASLGLAKPPVIRGGDLPPIPPSARIEVDQLDPEKSPDATPASGGPAVRELPDVVMALPDQATFTLPVVDHPPVENYSNKLTESGPGIGGPDFGPRGPSGTGIDDVTKLDRKPRATAQLAPDYPSSMHQQGIAGSVTVEFDVNAAGRVVRAEVVRSTRREFDEPALRAVRNWRFEPGKRNGRPVPFRMTVPIEFLVDAG